ncbi:MAG: sigma 54-interacting transcriptional regulator [Planctomycetes bacterium]|nr:sigma 54-interacting transcriptional regulator [Planctomycetota bacterium]
MVQPESDDADLHLLRQISEGTARATGDEFFPVLVRQLSAALAVDYALVARFVRGQPGRVRTLALWAKDRLSEPLEWDLAGTPCEEVMRGKMCHHPRHVHRLFPDDRPLVELGIESYLGVPLLDGAGRTMGHLAVFDTKAMPEQPRTRFVLEIFAARAVAELERLQAEEALRVSVEHFRQLFDEAPIAYVYEDTDTNFVSANRAAQKLLGLRPEEVAGTKGLSLVAKTPENLERLRPSLAAEQAGEALAAIEVELRRKDDGRPVWVQRWSHPEPDGKHTRTMLIDITARVLAERDKARLQQQNRYLQEEIKTGHDFDKIVGRAASLRDVLAKVDQVAATDATTLIFGETGTGKELIARAIHDRSRRRDKPLIKLNCASLPTGLVESELFGHEKGAFTGALDKRIGRFVLADGGSIFLDEIGDMPMEVQVKLLRVLQEQEFEPVGSTRTVRVNVRVIAATNRDLDQAVAAGTFRADLFYRLHVFPVRLPPLRERCEDIPALVWHFVGKFAVRLGKPVTDVPFDVLARLSSYHWPGNVRELENVIERAVILSAGPRLQIEPEMLRGTAAPAVREPERAVLAPPSKVLTLAEVEREHTLAALRQTNWVVEGPFGAAKLLGLNPNTLRSRIKKLGLTRESGEA